MKKELITDVKQEHLEKLEKGIDTIISLDVMVTDGIGYVAKIIKEDDLEIIINTMYQYIINLINEIKLANTQDPFLVKIPRELSFISEIEKEFAIELLDDIAKNKNKIKKLTPAILDQKLVDKAKQRKYTPNTFDGGKTLWCMILLLEVAKRQIN